MMLFLERPLLRLILDLISLPLHLVAYILPACRPLESWSYFQALHVRVTRTAVQVLSLLKPRIALLNLPGPQGDRFEVWPIARKDAYRGIVTIDPDVVPMPVGVTWYPARPALLTEGQYMVLHLHGGGYVLGDGRDDDAGFAANCLLTAGRGRISHVVCPQYRLASANHGRFPAALQDAITCYAHLVQTMHIPPSKIILSGDSAGGNLALALLRYLEEHRHSLPAPAHIWLWSPWVNPGSDLLDHSAHDRSARAVTDYTTSGFGVWTANSFRPASSTGCDLSSEYIRPLHNPFSTSASMFVCTGGAEVFLADNVMLAKQFGDIVGNQVKVYVSAGAPHDVILMGKKIGFVAEAQKCAEAAVETLAIG